MAKRKRNIWPFDKQTTYRVHRAPGRSSETTFKGFKVWKTWPEGFKTSADPDSLFDSLADVKRFIGTLGKNPAPKGAVRGNSSSFRYDVPYQILDSNAKSIAGFETEAAAFAAAQKMAKAGQRVSVGWRGADGEWRERWFGKRAARSNPRYIRRVQYHGFIIAERPDGLFVLKDKKGGKQLAIGRGLAAIKAEADKLKRNPSDEAASVYEEFHGRPSSQIVTVTEKIHYHKNLAALGELRTLVVIAQDGGKVTLSRFKKAILCTNEEKNQLFIRGGDQSVDPASFGIRKPHEVETLGKIVELAYFTRKDHLGDEGGTALYFHVTGETNENGKRKMAGWAPDLIYHTLDERLEFSGGSYFIRAEGIDK